MLPFNRRVVLPVNHGKHYSQAQIDYLYLEEGKPNAYSPSNLIRLGAQLGRKPTGISFIFSWVKKAVEGRLGEFPTKANNLIVRQIQDAHRRLAHLR